MTVGMAGAYAQSTLEGYQYWFNDDFANRTNVQVAPTQQLLLNQTIPTSGLSAGINVFHFQSYDNSGKHSSIISSFFYKASPLENHSDPKIVAYEYWLDEDVDNAVVVNTPVQQQADINGLLPMSALSNGVHAFNIRFKDDKGLWSSVTTQLFFKQQQQAVTQNVMTGYRYWLDDDFASAVHVPLAHGQQIDLIDSIDLTRITKGDHEIYFQFADIWGMWSVVAVDTVHKTSLPLADFSYAAVQSCDSTVVSFIDNSVDGDSYFWDFGDGTTASIPDPVHIYHVPNTYQVTLTVTDTLLGTDSTLVLPIVISSLHTAASIIATACDSYTAPDGQVFTASGIETAIIPNAAGCDSIITIALTIVTVDTSVAHTGITLTANATGAFYQWLDCNDGNSALDGETYQSFTAGQNGSYAVRVSENGCADTSACHTVTVVGVLENTFQHDITVFPNPTDGRLRIDLGETLHETFVTVNDMRGRTVGRSVHRDTDTFEVDIDARSGIYLLTIDSGNRRASIRVVKN